MKLSIYSERRLRNRLNYWGVYGDFEDPLYNYLGLGLDPGGFFSNALANDFTGAMSRCHLGNHPESIKALCGWLVNCCPDSAWGSHRAVSQWIDTTEDQRRQALLAAKLIYTEPEEVMLILQGADVNTEIIVEIG